MKVNMKYFNMTPRERVRAGYITWTDNFKLYSGDDVVKCYFGERFIISVISFLRFLFNYPLSFSREVEKFKKLKLNISQMNPEKYHESKL